MSDESDSLEDARKKYFADLREGTECPVCQRHGKIYRRKFNSSMARCLIALFNRDRATPGRWINIVRELSYKERGGDYGKLAYWGMVETERDPAEDGNSNGLFRITATGRQFIQTELRVDKYILLYNNREWPANEDLGRTTLKEALGAKFKLDELLGE